MRKSIVVAVANVALTGLVWGCGESVPQRSAIGGVMAGTEIERQRLAARKSPLMAGNGNAQVVAPAAAQTSASSAPRSSGAPAISSGPGTSSSAGVTGAGPSPSAPPGA